jgi:type IX secretion system PorP/SprF family membrane protein
MKITILLIAFLLSFGIVFSQQDEQSSMYMFNPLHFNPAYAGTRGALNATLIHRQQWVGFEGAPMSQFFSLHAPLAGRSLGAGLNISNDKAGALGRTSFFGNLAYSIKLSKKGQRLNFGASAGMDAVNFNFKDLVGQEEMYKVNQSELAFNAGFGAYYYSRKFYIGASMPRLKTTTWNLANFVSRHIFVAAGYVKPLNSVTDLKVSTLLKFVKNAPITVDANLNLFFYKTFWIGGMYRYNESAGANIAYQFKEQWMFGYAYDFVFNGLRQVTSGGSHELMLTYDMNGRRNVYSSPRYF